MAYMHCRKFATGEFILAHLLGFVYLPSATGIMSPMQAWASVWIEPLRL